MNLSEYHTLLLVALLQDINNLSAGQLAQQISTAQTNCTEFDAELLNRMLTSSTEFEASIVLQQANRLSGIINRFGLANGILTSVFNQIELPIARSPTIMAYRPVRWSLGSSPVFPVEVKKVQPSGNALLTQFQIDFINLFQSATHFSTLYAGTLTLLDEYLWAIPTNETDSDVPLSEALKLNSALVACLYHQAHAQTSLDPDAPFTLLAGDLSGIQSYVFGITEGGKGEEGTGKRLRARSLFVQLLAEIGMQKVLRVYNLPPANILMASGGKFHLLWPNMADNATQVRALQQQFDGWLLKQLNSEIGLALAYASLTEQELIYEFGQVLDRVERELRRVKHQKLASVLQDTNGWREDTFLLQAQVDNGLCRSCEKFPAEDKQDLCHHCALDEEVGSQIARGANFLAFYQDIPPKPGALSVLGSYVVVSKTREDLPEQPYLLLQLGGQATPSPTIPTLWRPPAPYVNSELRFIPMAQQGQGRALLGYLKADVDSLGAVLQWGLKRDAGRQLDTPARLSTLSRQLDRFFGLWLHDHLANTPDYQTCYTVFAGGDDLFVVGPWDIMTQLAADLQHAFTQFVGANPDVTLSIGLALVKPRYPLARAAHEAEDLLDQAKHIPALERPNQNGRNQIAFLGDVLTWSSYRLALIEQQNLLKDQPHSAFLYHLLQYADMWRKYCRGDPGGLRFQPMLAYNITRNVDARRQPNLRRWADRLVKIPLDETAKQVLNHLGVVSSLVIFTQRSREE